MTYLYLLRHGSAEQSKPHQQDASRSLTEDGRQEIQAQTQRHINDLKQIQRIIYSPYLRTKQTAELVNEMVGVELEPSPKIIPSGNAQLVCESLADMESDLLVVSHLPIIAEIGFAIMGKHCNFFPATLVKLHIEDAFQMKGKLEWVTHAY